MRRRVTFEVATMAVSVAAFTVGMFAQQGPGPEGRGATAGRRPAAVRPPLFFREEWKQPPYVGQLTEASRHATQDAVANPNLELTIYGACKNSTPGLQVYGTPKDTIFPVNLWTGLCAAPLAVTLRDRDSYVDLTGTARIRWVTRAANLHAVRPVLKLVDGTLIVGDHVDVTPAAIGQPEPEMVESEFSIAPTRWYALDPERVATTRPVDTPNLSKVDEVGFADLMPGGGHGSAGWINVGAIEVYGKPVKR
jgi:hypothetical protein